MATGSMDFDGSIAFSVRYESETEATGTMPIQNGILNPFGSVHAGAMIWFADVVATTLALQGTMPTPGMSGFPLAINLSANLLSNSKDGTLHATAQFVKHGRRVSTVRTVVTSDDGRQLLELTSTHIPA
ncbi:PaaI family thioesterase [Ruegeria jejuensis]|uniref:PaaI family thioesterase n=1 Tax=Ruegeria jejuensis TaxID=3233338 RepID=UPI00355C597A